MNCRSCGAALPTGVGFCISCGSPTPYNTTGQGTPAPYQPTVAATPPSSPASSGSYAETVAASPYSGTPPTAYGAPPSPLNPYAPQTPSTPSGGSTPDQYGAFPPSPYSTPGAPPSPYGTPGTPPSPYGQPGTPPPYGFNNAAGYPPAGMPGTYPPVPQQPPKRGSKVGLIVGLVILALVVICGGSVAVLYSIGKNQISKTNANVSATVTAASGTVNALDTPTTGAVTTPTTSTSSGSGSSPSGQSIDPAAAAIVSNVVTAQSIDKNTSEPIGVSTTFQVNQKFDVIADINSNGSDGYVLAKFYLNNNPFDKLILHHHAQYNVGYFPTQYTSAGNGTAELYWCTKADYSDAKLAQVVQFTITA